MSHKSFWDQDLNVLIDTIENNSKIGSHSQLLLLRVNNAHRFKKESEMRHTKIIPYVSTYLPGSCNLRATFMILVKFILFCLCVFKKTGEWGLWKYDAQLPLRASFWKDSMAVWNAATDFNNHPHWCNEVGLSRRPPCRTNGDLIQGRLLRCPELLCLGKH